MSLDEESPPRPLEYAPPESGVDRAGEWRDVIVMIVLGLTAAGVAAAYFLLTKR